MDKKRLCLFFGILLAVSTVFAGGVTMEKDTELHATNLTFKINNTIMFESPVKISNDGYAFFGTQNFSVLQNTGQINITVLNHTNSSASSGTNFWFFIEGQNENINITLNNIPGAVRGLSETDSSGTSITSDINSVFYDSHITFTLNATSSGKYIEVGFSTPTTTTISSGGGSGGGSSSSATTTISQEEVTTTISQEEVTTTISQEEVTTTTIDTITDEETKQPFPLKTVTIGVLILATLAVIFWLLQSLKGEQKPESDKSKNLT